MKRVVVAIALSACSTPTPQLRIGYAAGPVQACPSTVCDKIPLPCDAVLSIRILDPGTPPDQKVYLQECMKVSPDIKRDLCSINSIELDTTPLPVHDLEVQVAVYPMEMLQAEANGDPICPTIQYSSATGFPVEQVPAPAFGGRAFYHPGDSFVDVTLGCTDLSSVTGSLSCGQSATGSLTATVEDFDTRLSVTGGQGGLAEDLFVSVGEPHQLSGGYVLKPRDAIGLHLDDGDLPKWTAPTSQSFTRAACVEVLEDVAQTVASLRCIRAVDPLPDLSGTRISRDRLQRIIDLLALPGFPEDGLTIGMVVDKLSIGVPGYVVTPSSGSVVYLSNTGILGGSMTSDTGIFVSTDAPFGTLFSASGANATVTAIGGKVAGKVTIAIVSPAP